MAKSKSYDEFVDKFKPKLTTDDCYTPPIVYEAVLKWCREHLDMGDAEVVRPFYPGGDYKSFAYPEGCIVIDNPPFSIFAEIRRWYQERGIRYFLFAPHLTLFGSRVDDTAIIVDVSITYENGAKVNTAFVTNCLGEVGVMTAPELARSIAQADEQNRAEKRITLPRYTYPANVLTVSAIAPLAPYVSISIPRSRLAFIRRLDAQREHKKAIFGGGYLIPDEEAHTIEEARRKAEEARKRAEEARRKAEEAQSMKWSISEREREIILSLR